MKVHNLNKNVEFSSERPIKKHFLNSKGFHAALICLKSGVEIEPHPEDYSVFLRVLEGHEIFTNSNGSFPLEKIKIFSSNEGK